MGRLRRTATRFVPRTLRARLVLAFAGVVAIALVLVLVTLPRLLDDYFYRQEQQDLDSRAGIAVNLVRLQLIVGLDLRGAKTSPEPILLATDPPALSAAAEDQFGDVDDPQSLLGLLVQQVGHADVDVAIAPDPKQPQHDAIHIRASVSAAAASPGQQRDPLEAIASTTITDTFYSQSASLAPKRLITVTLSDPYTFRARTQQTVLGVLLAAAAAGLLIAIVLSVIIADRLTTPIRRLTQVSRRLEQGDLQARAGASARSASPELTELGKAFDRMAARLEESIELIRRDRDRSRDFLADVSHELRTPIAALRTFNELLSDDGTMDPAARREFLASSRQQLERLDWLAQNLLELSKLDSGLVALDLRPDDLRAVVENALEQAEPAARRRQVSLSSDLPRQPLRLRHDPPRMGQVLSNLIGNALKFTPPGGRVTVRLAAVPGGAELHVSDTGVGIPAHELPHVFERFYRGAQDSELRASGSGLGLSIVRSIVEMHGGRVTIESTLGQGTEVTVFLPRDVANPSSGPSSA